MDDLVKGEVRWAPGELRDFVLVRADGSPVFLLAVAVDDLLMERHARRPGRRPAGGGAAEHRR